MLLTNFLGPVLYAGTPHQRILELLQNAFVYAIAEGLNRVMSRGQHDRVVVVW